MGGGHLQQVTEIGGDAIIGNVIGSGGGEHCGVINGKRKDEGQ